MSEFQREFAIRPCSHPFRPTGVDESQAHCRPGNWFAPVVTHRALNARERVTRDQANNKCEGRKQH
jgi:hypothetical protein